MSDKVTGIIVDWQLHIPKERNGVAVSFVVIPAGTGKPEQDVYMEPLGLPLEELRRL